MIKQFYFPPTLMLKGTSFGGRHCLSLQTIKVTVPFTTVAIDVFTFIF